MSRQTEGTDQPIDQTSAEKQRNGRVLGKHQINPYGNQLHFY